MYWMGVLISWAMPAAREPMDSSFWAWRSWTSICLRSRSAVLRCGDVPGHEQGLDRLARTAWRMGLALDSKSSQVPFRCRSRYSALWGLVPAEHLGQGLLDPGPVLRVEQVQGQAARPVPPGNSPGPSGRRDWCTSPALRIHDVAIRSVTFWVMVVSRSWLRRRAASACFCSVTSMNVVSDPGRGARPRGRRSPW